MKRTYKKKIAAELSLRSLSKKAFDFYTDTDPLDVYEYETEDGTRYDVTGCFTYTGLTFKELEQEFEMLAEEFVEEEDE